jgi:hypothetical protein
MPAEISGGRFSLRTRFIGVPRRGRNVSSIAGRKSLRLPKLAIDRRVGRGPAYSRSILERVR